MTIIYYIDDDISSHTKIVDMALNCCNFLNDDYKKLIRSRLLSDFTGAKTIQDVANIISLVRKKYPALLSSAVKPRLEYVGYHVKVFDTDTEEKK